MKHDAHVRTAFIHFFPMKTVLVILSFAFLIGVLLGQFWGFNSCYDFKILLD